MKSKLDFFMISGGLKMLVTDALGRVKRLDC